MSPNATPLTNVSADLAGSVASTLAVSDWFTGVATEQRLAVLGGPPAFATPLHVGRPVIAQREQFLQRINGALDRQWLTNQGQETLEFEQRVAAISETEHCVATSSGTAALTLVANGLGLEGEVIMPALTFIATAHALAWQGIQPVFADVDPVTFSVDPDHVASLVTPRTTGIMGVHLWGIPCDVVGLQRVAKRYGLKLLYDAAHAFGCSAQGQMIGGFGDAEAFSFHATKFVNAAEGGAVVTNDTQLADRLRLIRNFGFSDVDTVSCLGTNAKMNELCAAMGNASLSGMQNVVDCNRAHFAIYRQELAGLPGIRLVAPPQDGKQNHQYVIVLVNAPVAGLSRDEMVNVLARENILARRYFYPGCHRQEPYCREQQAGGRLPVTEHVVEQCLALPTGPALSEADVRIVCRVFRLALHRATEIRGRLADELA